MKFRLLAAIAGLALATGAAHAQIGIYGTPVFSRISNTNADSGPFAFLGQNATSAIFKGFGVGVYDDFLHSGSTDAGVDLRASILRGNGSQFNSFLIGARVAFNSHSRMNPYIEALGGVGGSKAAASTIYFSKLEYGIAGGLDYKLGRRVDFRVFEVNLGSVQTISSNSFAQTTTPPSSVLINISTGFVFHIP
jgi:hypothetical protein